MEWWLWIDWWLLFSIRHSRLYQVPHKKYEALATNPPIHIYISRINNRLVLKIDGYKLELQTPETMKLFASTKRINKEQKKMSLEVVELVVV